MNKSGGGGGGIKLTIKGEKIRDLTLRNKMTVGDPRRALRIRRGGQDVDRGRPVDHNAPRSRPPSLYVNIDKL